MSQTEIRRRMVEEEEALGIFRRICPFFGRSCRTVSSTLTEALPMQTPQKTSGWKLITSCVAASRFGQQ